MEWVIGASPQVEYESKWRSITAKLLSMTVLMVLVVGLRLWVRRKSLHREDWVTVITALFSITYCASNIIQTRYGLGLPIHLRPEEDQRDYAIVNYISRPFYLWGIAGFKLALCLMYLRMTKRSLDPRFRWFIIGVAMFSTTAQTVFVCMSLFSCIPLRKMFDPSIQGRCLPYASVSYTMSAITICCDVVIFLIPIPLVYRLRLEKTVKLGLTVIFGLGLLTTVCSILRLQQIDRVVNGDGDSTMFVVRSGMELNVGIITSCLPVLRPFLSYLPRRLKNLVPFSSTHRAHSDGQSTLPSANCFKMKAPRTARMQATIHRSTTSISAERIVSVQAPEEALLRSESDGSEWRNSGVLKTVEVDVGSSYVQSPGTPRTGHGVGEKMITRWEWE